MESASAPSAQQCAARKHVGGKERTRPFQPTSGTAHVIAEQQWISRLECRAHADLDCARSASNQPRSTSARS
eukprot:9612872-Alexandrium_andersonii.AAC.1